jgi:hypothetical protein
MTTRPAKNATPLKENNPERRFFLSGAGIRD